jgi:hypothetical protein
MQETYDLAKWKEIVIRGENQAKLNPCASWEDYMKSPGARVA